MSPAQSQHAHWFIRSRLKTRQLLLLACLDQERNIHRASSAMAITQPAASKLLKEIEEALGVALFNRLPRGVEPTPSGEIMIRHARMMLAHLSDAKEEIDALRKGLTGLIHMGVVAGPGAVLVPQAIARMNQQFPRVQVRVDLAVSNLLLPKMKEGQLDIVVARLSPKHDDGQFVFEQIAVEPIRLVVRAGHPLARKRSPTLADLLPCAFVLPPVGDLLRHRFDMLFHQQGLVPPQQGVETLALQVLTGLLLRTDMVAVLGQEVAQPYVDAGLFALLKMPLDLALDPYGIVTRRQVLLSPSAQAMCDILRQEALSLYGPATAPRTATPAAAKRRRPTRP